MSKTAFLIGAGRSGTTLLYKILCLHSKVAFISNYDNRAAWLPAGLVAGLVSSRTEAKLKAWFNAGGNAYFINRPLIRKVFPTPVEGESVYQECGMPLHPEPDYSPDDDTIGCLVNKFEKIRRAASADIMLSKRTANNRRLHLLDSIFPRAKYIHLIRDGRDVANSLCSVEWWDDHVVWWDGRTARQMEKDGEERLKICARNWVNEVRELDSRLMTIDKERILEVRFEQFLSDPVGNLEIIMEFLALEMTDEYRRAIESLELVYRPRNWRVLWSPEQLDMVLAEQRAYLGKYGYLQGYLK